MCSLASVAPATCSRCRGSVQPTSPASIASGLVTRNGDRVRFVHSLYQEALYHDLPRERRQALHREAARSLAATDAPAAEIAHHLLESGPEHAADAIEQTIIAAREALDM